MRTLNEKDADTSVFDDFKTRKYTTLLAHSYMIYTKSLMNGKKILVLYLFHHFLKYEFIKHTLSAKCLFLHFRKYVSYHTSYFIYNENFFKV